MSLKMVFMGTPEFSIPTLKALIENKFDILSIYTQPPKKSKRGQKIHVSAVEQFCKNNSINVKNPISLNSKEEFEIFKNSSPDLGVVVAYGKIIPKRFLPFFLALRPRTLAIRENVNKHLEIHKSRIPCRIF